jgi:GDP-mannose 6-dehydrogenase
MKISVFGLGYVGCVSAASLARGGHEVIGCDVSAQKVSIINSGESPIVEPGLGEALAQAVQSGNLRATMDAAEAIDASDAAILCVGTPGGSNGKLDASALRAVGRQIGRALRPNEERPFTVVLRSTVLPGTCERVLLPALEEGGRLPGLKVAVNPEFLREGVALEDYADPPFILIGCDSDEAEAVLREIYRRIEGAFLRTDLRTAEMIKYACNAFHALKVTFANEIAEAAAAFGADGHQVMRVVALDRKLNISAAYLRPGFAFGGSCLPKDLRALLHASRSSDLTLPLLSSILPSNERQIRRAISEVLATRKRRIGLVGLAFKAGTDDLRESAMVSLAEALIGKGCDLRILDGSVSIARLHGANRRYIEEEIPHIGRLMCQDVESLLAHAEVVLIGNASEEAERARAAAGPQHMILDLTQGPVSILSREALEPVLP